MDLNFILKWFADTYGGSGNLVPAVLILAGAVWGSYQLFTGRAAGSEELIKIKTGDKNKC
jgi:hypothetical protein